MEWRPISEAPIGERIIVRDRDGRNIAFGRFGSNGNWEGEDLPDVFEWKAVLPKPPVV